MSVAYVEGMARCGWPHPKIGQWTCTLAAFHETDRCVLCGPDGGVFSSWPGPASPPPVDGSENPVDYIAPIAIYLTAGMAFAFSFRESRGDFVEVVWLTLLWPAVVAAWLLGYARMAVYRIVDFFHRDDTSHQ